MLVGKDGPTGGDIVHAGRVAHDRVTDFLAAADVCAYILKAPHSQFGFSPLKLYEYMAAGRAVVAATDLPEIHDFVNGAGVGTAVALDVDRFARSIGDVLASPDRRTEMGRKGRLLAEAQFGWNRAVGQVEESLRRAVAP